MLRFTKVAVHLATTLNINFNWIFNISDAAPNVFFFPTHTNAQEIDVYNLTKVNIDPVLSLIRLQRFQQLFEDINSLK